MCPRTTPIPVHWYRSRAVASPHTGRRRPTRASWSWPKRATSGSGGRAGPVSVTTVRADWCRGRSSTDRSHSTSPPMATSSCAVHNRFATSSSICETSPSHTTTTHLWPHVEDEGAADQNEAEARRDERHQHRTREDRQDRERSAPRHAPRTQGHLRGLRASQDFALEDVVGNVNAYEQPRVHRDRGGREPRTRDPGRCKGQERHHEEMGEVDPDQSQRRRTDEPHQVMVVDPNDGDEQVAHRIADGRGPQRPESRECRLL